MEYDSCGETGGSRLSHSGPSLHNLLTSGSTIDRLLEGNSAGFESPEQWNWGSHCAESPSPDSL